MKAPNGYGAIVDLGEGRRKRYAVRMTVGYKPNSKGSLTPITKYVGYYATPTEAFRARDEYNRQVDPLRIPTFGEVMEQFNEEHFPDIAESTRKMYESAARKCATLSSRAVSDISYVDLQDLVKASSSGAQSVLRSYLKQVFTFAYVRDWISKNPAEYLKVEKKEKSTIHYKYTSEEIAELWKHDDDPVVAFVLLSIYTGMRPGELLEAERDGNTLVVRQGKTANAARFVPVHRDAVQLLEFMPFDFARIDRKSFVNCHFCPALDAIGVLWYTHPETGKKQKHKPHDGRHTFTSQWKAQRLNEGIRAYVQGHTQKDIGGRIYTHYDLDDVRAEVDKLDFCSGASESLISVAPN